MALILTASLQSKGRPVGVGIGRIYTTYECIFDENAARHGHPLNKRACHVLGRADIYGQVLFKKTNRIKIVSDRTVVAPSGEGSRPSDELGWEILCADELRSDEFRAKMREWPRVQEWHASELRASRTRTSGRA